MAIQPKYQSYRVKRLSTGSFMHMWLNGKSVVKHDIP